MDADEIVRRLAEVLLAPRGPGGVRQLFLDSRSAPAKVAVERADYEHDRTLLLALIDDAEGYVQNYAETVPCSGAIACAVDGECGACDAKRLQARVAALGIAPKEGT